MYFDSLHALLVMEGHGAYVWTAYGVSLAVIVMALVAPVRRHKRLLRQLGVELKRVQGAPGASSRGDG